MSIGRNILRMREKQGMNQTQLAKEVGVTQSAICQIEKGIRNPSLQVGSEIARALGCSMEDLLDERER